MTLYFAALVVGASSLEPLVRSCDKFLEREYAGAAFYALAAVGLVLLAVNTWRLA